MLELALGNDLLDSPETIRSVVQMTGKARNGLGRLDSEVVLN